MNEFEAIQDTVRKLVISYNVNDDPQVKAVCISTLRNLLTNLCGDDDAAIYSDDAIEADKKLLAIIKQKFGIE